MSTIDLLPSQSGNSVLNVATAAAKEAGQILKDNFLSENQVKVKGRSNLVSEVDVLAERAIIELVTREYPSHGILSEESNPLTPISGYTWIIDPLDGTNNYIFGLPFFCVNIALAKEGDVILGITYDPIRDELFHVQKSILEKDL